MTNLFPSGVHLWWYALCFVALFNIGAWLFSVVAYRRRLQGGTAPAQELVARWPHLLLSAGYVVGCAFRSVLPRADVQRIVLYDSWLSSVFVGRSVATVAELCFAAQWALMLHELSRAHRLSYGIAVARAIVPVIAVAEICSWYAVLTTSYLGNTLEQSLWTATVVLMGSALAMLALRTEGRLRAFLGFVVVACAAFVVFMTTVDVPMYFGRWLADEASGRAYLSFADGLRDVSTRWVVTHQWYDWHEEIAWMTLYFSCAVWISIGLIHAPRAATMQVSPPRRQVAQPERRISSVPKVA